MNSRGARTFRAQKDFGGTTRLRGTTRVTSTGVRMRIDRTDTGEWEYPPSPGLLPSSRVQHLHIASPQSSVTRAHRFFFRVLGLPALRFHKHEERLSPELSGVYAQLGTLSIEISGARWTKKNGRGATVLFARIWRTNSQQRFQRRLPEFTCTCGKKLVIKPRQRGKRLNCPGCRAVVECSSAEDSTSPKNTPGSKRGPTTDRRERDH